MRESPAIYLHIPFCVRRCPYCDFTSRRVDQGERVPYLEALCKEIASCRFPVAEARTLFVGGGTPSELTGDEIDRIIRAVESVFDFERSSEWTLECNPGTINPASCDRFLELGFNRISLGVQSFHNGHLRTLGRIHNAETSLESYGHCRNAGFENVNLDLIFGVPYQKLDDWKDDLAKAVELGPEHLSLYHLTLEPGTAFHRRRELGLFPEIDEDLCADMYETAIEAMEEAGYLHYEISNFALPGYECTQNLSYWTNSPYLGFGISAASYFDRVRWTNTQDWKEYLESASRGEVARAVTEKLTASEALGEESMLRLRMREGIPVADISRKYGIDFLEFYSDVLEELQRRRLLLQEDGYLRLSRKGVLLADEVCKAFLRP